MDQNQYKPYQPHPVEPYKKKKVPKRTKLALWFILGPTALIALSFITFAVFNSALGNIPTPLPDACNGSQLVVTKSDACNDILIANFTPAEMTISVLLLLLCGLGMVAWLPGLIAGLILLAKNPHTTKSDTPSDTSTQ